MRALATGGPDAVRIEPLAKALGVSRGGFYWHFEDRPALLGEILDTWERMTTDEVIESTTASSGEAEPVLLHTGGRLWVGVGSDHTDREVESYGVAVAKELCAKPLATEWWAYDEVAARWDELILRSWITENGAETPYQEGALASLLPPTELLKLAEPQLTDGTLMFCGTLPARGGIRSASTFRYELEDPTRRHALRGRYTMRPLPIIS